ncbi:MAG TPA: response regulator [Bryobacteraceae bacterium]|nr:response regulator [Bryobacteraceae bacterium]
MPVRVLIIEDHADNLELMNYLLKAFGYATVTAADGLAGMELARNQDLGLILCDIQLPGIDGFEVARRLKQDERLRSIPLVAITALAMVGDRERALAVGFDGYLAKPIDPETFVASVEAFLKPEERRQRDYQAATAAEPVLDGTRKTQAVARGTILVVDNVPANLELAQSIFEPSGFHVMLADNVTVALAMAKQNRPDVVLSDVNMPEGTGFELARRMRADPDLRTVPVVLISATLPRDVSTEVARSAGATKFLWRPIDPVILLEEVESCLQAARRSSGNSGTGQFGERQRNS